MLALSVYPVGDEWEIIDVFSPEYGVTFDVVKQSVIPDIISVIDKHKKHELSVDCKTFHRVVDTFHAQGGKFRNNPAQAQYIFDVTLD